MTIEKFKPLIPDSMLESIRIRNQMDLDFSKEEIILNLIKEIESLKVHIKMLEKKASSGF